MTGGGSASLDGGTRVSTLTAPDDPVVLVGTSLPQLHGVAVSHVVAFVFGPTGWEQIPTQVDERDLRTVDSLYGAPCPGSNATDIGSMAALRIGVFTDPSTPVGADTVAGLDDDDEVVVMADDLGGRAPMNRAAPAGTTGPGQEVRIQRAGTPGQVGYVYFFQSATLSQGAGITPVTNAFVLTNGGTYNNCLGVQQVGTPSTCNQTTTWGIANPENTVISTANYTRHFSGRWLSDGLNIGPVGNRGPDLLDLNEVRPGPPGPASDNTAGRNAACIRSATSFSGSRGVVLTKTAGPLRAIRSEMGANSGGMTQRTHLFYARREDMVTELRVHPINGIHDVTDFSPAVTGMQYTRTGLANAVTVDGSPETLPTQTYTDPATFKVWEALAGTPVGASQPVTIVTVHHSLDTVGIVSATRPIAFFYDDNTNAVCPCNSLVGGDTAFYGLSGISVINAENLPSTDPRLCGGSRQCPATAPRFMSHRSMYYLQGNLTPAQSAARADGMLLNPDIQFADFATRTAAGNQVLTCGDGACRDGESNVSCSGDCGGPSGAICGDHTCNALEEDAVKCPADCSTTAAHGGFLACLQTNCATAYSTCTGDPDCSNGLGALATCTASQASCLTSSLPRTQPGKGLYQSVTTSTCQAGCTF